MSISREQKRRNSSNTTIIEKIEGKIPSFSSLYPGVTTLADENLDPLAPLVPHEKFEGKHMWDPYATWTTEEEAQVVRKTDWRLLGWFCIMYFGECQTVPGPSHDAESIDRHATGPRKLDECTY